MTLRHLDIISAVSDAIAQQLHAHAAIGSRGRLIWRLTDRNQIVGQVNAGITEQDVPAELGRWAAALDLTEHTDVGAGVREYRGELDGVTVVVWGIVDRNAFGSP